MPRVSIEDIAERFPDFRVAFVIAEPLSVGPRGPELAKDIAAAEAECRRRWAGVELSAIAEVAAWRAAYKGFGVKRTSYRSSAERLIKRVLAGQPLPEINALVDLCNMVSLETGLCLGCDDLDKTSGDLVFRFSQAGRQLRRYGRGAWRGSERSAEGGRSRLCRRSPRALPAVELAPGRKDRFEPRDSPGRADRPVERRRRRRSRRCAPRRSHRPRMRRPNAGSRRWTGGGRRRDFRAAFAAPAGVTAARTAARCRRA